MRAILGLGLIASLLAIASAPPAASHDHATGIVKKRMDMMEDMDKRLKSIRRKIERKRDLASIKTDAEAIASHAPHLAHLFPSGSMHPPTKAKRLIWQNWSDFEHQVKALETESKKLSTIAADDLAALTTQARTVSQICADCHERYRARK